MKKKIALFLVVALLSLGLVSCNETIKNKRYNSAIDNYYISLSVKQDFVYDTGNFYYLVNNEKDGTFNVIYDLSNVDKKRIEKTKATIPLYQRHNLPIPPFELIYTSNYTIYILDDNNYFVYMKIRDVNFIKVNYVRVRTL